MRPGKSARVTFASSRADKTFSLFVLTESGAALSALYAGTVDELKRIALAWLDMQGYRFDEVELAHKLQGIRGGTTDGPVSPTQPSPAADYGIEGICYDATGDRIDRAKIREIRGSIIGPPAPVTRERLIYLVQRRTLITFGKQATGALVRLVIVDGAKYLRADERSVAADYLG